MDITGTANNDTLTGTDSFDNIGAGDGNDVLRGGLGSDWLFGGAGNDTLEGGDGNDTLQGGDGDDFLDGGQSTGERNVSEYGYVYYTGGDELIGGSGNDTLVAEGWNDYLSNSSERSSGSDTYIIKGISGQVVIQDDSVVGNGDHIVYLGANASSPIDPSLLGLRKEDKDLVLYQRPVAGLPPDLNAPINGRVLIPGFFNLLNEGNSRNAIEYIEFANGTKWTLADIQARLTMATSGNDELVGQDLSDRIDGGLGNDLISGAGGNDTLIGGEGNDTLYAGSGNNLLQGGNGADQLYSEGGNDTLEGGAGDDVYEIRGGHIVIADADVGLRTTINAIQNETDFNWSAQDLKYTKTGLDLVIDSKDNAAAQLASVTIKGYFNAQLTDPGASEVVFTNFSLLQRANVNALLQVSDGDDLIQCLSNRDTAFVDDELSAGAGNDTVYANGGRDIIKGEDGNDVLYGGDGHDVLEGGRGNDYLDGGLINDPTFNGGDDLYGGAGNDTLVAEGAEDYLYGGTGADTFVFKGFSGKVKLFDDTVSGDGDRIVLIGADATRPLGQNDVSFSADQYGGHGDLVISLKSDPNNQIVVREYFEASGRLAHAATGPDTIEFGNGDVLTRADITKLFNVPTTSNDIIRLQGGDDTVDGLGGIDDIKGGAGNDVLIGSPVGSDTLSGDDGNDLLVGASEFWGGRGDDTLDGSRSTGRSYFNAGSGSDLIRVNRFGGYLEDDTDAITWRDASNRDVIEFTDGITQADVSFVDLGFKDLRVQFNNSDKFLSIDNFFANRSLDISGKIDAFVFADGTRRSANDVASEIRLATNGDNRIEANAAGSRVQGDASNQIIVGNVGNDTLLGGAGDDVLDASLGGQDALYGEAGHDHLFSSSSNAKDAVYLDGGVDNDTLIGGAGDDTLVGGSGYDLMAGRGGRNTYISRLADYGDDTVIASQGDVIELQDFRLTADKLVFTTLYSQSGVSEFSEYKSGVRLYAKGGTSSLDIYNTELSSVWKWDLTLRFADGSTMRADEIAAGGKGVSLTGTAGADVLRGGQYGDTLIGLAGNDTLVGGGGHNIYQFDAGFGNDLIQESNDDRDDRELPLDEIVFGSGILAQDLLLSRSVADADGTRDLVIRSRISSDTLTIADQSLSLVSALRLSDGSVIDVRNAAAATNPNAGVIADTYRGNGVLQGLAGHDTLIGGTGNDQLIAADGGWGRLQGGLGNDTLTGGKGKDTFVFSAGDGQDLIHADGQDLIELGQGLSRSNLVIGRLGATAPDTVVLGFKGSTDTITLDKAGQWDGLQLKFTADGSSLSGAQLMAEATKPIEPPKPPNLTLNGTAGKDNLLGGLGNDTLNGLAGNDTLSGGKGDDLLVGGKGNDTYLFARGDGKDTIVDNDSTWFNADALKVSGAKANQLWLSKAGNNLDIGIIGTQDHVIVQNWFSGSANQVETITALGDNKSLSASKVNALVSAMAKFSAPSEGVLTLPTATQAGLSKILASSWA